MGNVHGRHIVNFQLKRNCHQTN